MEYNRRGLVAVRRQVAGEAVEQVIEYDAARQPARVELHHPERLTEQHFEYDVRLRPRRTYVLREPTGAAPDLSAVTVPFDQTYGWDAASNLVSVTDERIGEEWDDGQLPQSATIGHDSLYRVASVDYTYTHQSGEAVYQDLATDWRTDRAFHEAADPMAERPAPKIGALPPDRVVNLTYEYDWLANMVEWTDDAHDFYERSIGDIDNGFEHGLRPSALYLSTDLPASPPAHSPTTVRGGWLELEYGEGGNVVSMTVHGSCRDVNEVTLCWDDEGADLGSRRAQLRAQCLCASEQHYQYRWDELDRIAEARRYDRAGAGPWDLAVRQRYRYDGANVRTHKETFDDGGEPRTALYAHPGAYERSGVHRDSQSSSYTAHPTYNTESQYLVGGARIVCKHAPGDPLFEADFRMTYALTDLLGSTSAVIDLWSGELLEVGTFYPSGAQETLASQQSVAVQPEPMGFTGKEADDEVGVVYFGERYLIPRIGRWASPDPLHVHAVGGGEALNSYHYIGGNILQARDPLGLSCTGPGCDGSGSAIVGDEGDYYRVEVDEEAGTMAFSEIPQQDAFREETGAAIAEGVMDNVPTWAGLRDVVRRPPAEQAKLLLIDSVMAILTDVGRLFTPPESREEFLDQNRAGGRVLTGATVDIAAARAGTSLRTLRLPRVRRRVRVPSPEPSVSGRVDHVASSGGGPTTSTAIRPVGAVLGTADDVLANPQLLAGRSVGEVRMMIGRTPGWANDVMRRSARHPGGGWVFREMNAAGTDFTGRMIQYHPGTPRHFGGAPYWKVSGVPGQGPVRIPLQPGAL